MNTFDIQTNKEEFIRIYKENIHREGSEELLKWIEKTDFFTAPASTRYHNACEGGLCAHSLSVYHTLMDKHFDEETGKWEKVPYFTIDDKFPYGHGEKSVFLIERKMRLRLDEAMAIRWHMGGFDEGGGFSISQAYDKYPLAVKLRLADLESTYLREKGTSEVNKR